MLLRQRWPLAVKECSTHCPVGELQRNEKNPCFASLERSIFSHNSVNEHYDVMSQRGHRRLSQVSEHIPLLRPLCFCPLLLNIWKIQQGISNFRGEAMNTGLTKHDAFFHWLWTSVYCIVLSVTFDPQLDYILQCCRTRDWSWSQTGRTLGYQDQSRLCQLHYNDTIITGMIPSCRLLCLWHPEWQPVPLFQVNLLLFFLGKVVLFLFFVIKLLTQRYKIHTNFSFKQRYFAERKFCWFHICRSNLELTTTTKKRYWSLVLFCCYFSRRRPVDLGTLSPSRRSWSRLTWYWLQC